MKKEVQEYILSVLKLLKEKIKTGTHSFQLGEDGRLWLWVQVGDKFQSIIFDEDYQDIEPAELVDGIVKTLVDAGYSVPSEEKANETTEGDTTIDDGDEEGGGGANNPGSKPPFTPEP